MLTRTFFLMKTSQEWADFFLFLIEKYCAIILYFKVLRACEAFC